MKSTRRLRPALWSALGVLGVSCSVQGFTSAPRFMPDLGPGENCCPIELRGSGYVLHWEIRSASAAKASVSIVEISMDKERCQVRQLDPVVFQFLPDRPQPLELAVLSPPPVEGRTVSVTLQPQMNPMPDPTTGSCTICRVAAK